MRVDRWAHCPDEELKIPARDDRSGVQRFHRGCIPDAGNQTTGPQVSLSSCHFGRLEVGHYLQDDFFWEEKICHDDNYGELDNFLTVQEDWRRKGSI